VDLGVTAIELMPLADFAGKRNWGYDGVLPYAPDSVYGRPEELKALIDAAHGLGLMVLLDVVYNHFGPKGNYLPRYAPQFFTDRHQTPWGAAIDFSNDSVRKFFVHNVRYWLEEYRFDGLRFDAVHAIIDESPRHILDEICASVPAGKHLVLENDANQARFIGPGKYTAQWNDDSHHGYHVLATGESDGYYVAYADAPAKHLARCLAEGFAYQGEESPFSREPRGEPSAHLPPSCFVDFLQNHDQIGNRAFGERLLSLSNERSLKALSAIQLLAPSPPLLFMGEEWGCQQPFLFFCDFDGELGEAVRKGRREEFSRFASFRNSIPDPLAESTFRQCVLDWTRRDAGWLSHYKKLLQLRARAIAPRRFGPGTYRLLGERAFEVKWSGLTLIANCGEQKVAVKDAPREAALWSNGKPGEAWSVNWWC
jgi:malto-oligosyltrehalose trehalohydrolase